MQWVKREKSADMRGNQRSLTKKKNRRSETTRNGLTKHYKKPLRLSHMQPTKTKI